MPFKSEKQRRYLHANEPKLAKKWEHKYVNPVVTRTGRAAQTDDMIKKKNYAMDWEREYHRKKKRRLSDYGEKR